MPDTVVLLVNGLEVTMPAGSMVSAAIMKTGVSAFRHGATVGGAFGVAGLRSDGIAYAGFWNTKKKRSSGRRGSRSGGSIWWRVLGIISRAR